MGNYCVIFFLHSGFGHPRAGCIAGVCRILQQVLPFMLLLGFSSLVCASILGLRRDFHIHRGESPYVSLPLTCIGATMLWTGWFGFNGGSALQAGTGAVCAVINLQVAAAVCSCCFLFSHMLPTIKKASLIAMINRAIAGLAGITPTSGYMTVHGAIVCAIFIAICANLSVYLIKHKLWIDDAVDVSSINGAPGLVGAIFIGLAGSSEFNGADGLVYGGGVKLFGLQCLGNIVAAAMGGCLGPFYFTHHWPLLPIASIRRRGTRRARSRTTKRGCMVVTSLISWEKHIADTPPRTC
ncbi:putative ammonium transporter [Trypanosoma conorhini]|uniref:Putative ammonium transporter n=1 Tax=Trypanosoma conorhini TaxID=83891 RepID=A0A3R7L719_9TRYP|nr:putative ammonium transporter [Trypanosoma conorhini]RNF22353.1 putative ammonium transporter [Trypanosoma conorhini]